MKLFDIFFIFLTLYSIDSSCLLAPGIGCSAAGPNYYCCIDSVILFILSTHLLKCEFIPPENYTMEVAQICH